jgi:hypothetical protein
VICPFVPIIVADAQSAITVKAGEYNLIGCVLDFALEDDAVAESP